MENNISFLVDSSTRQYSKLGCLSLGAKKSWKRHAHVSEASRVGGPLTPSIFLPLSPSLARFLVQMTDKEKVLTNQIKNLEGDLSALAR